VAKSFFLIDEENENGQDVKWHLAKSQGAKRQKCLI
jgi:hypothetical protein